MMGSASLTEDTLHTLFCEVEAIVNSRPLGVISSDAKDLEVITPNRLLIYPSMHMLVSQPSLDYSESLHQYLS